MFDMTQRCCLGTIFNQCIIVLVAYSLFFNRRLNPVVLLKAIDHMIIVFVVISDAKDTLLK